MSKPRLFLVLVLVFACLGAGALPAQAASGVSVRVGCSAVTITFTTTDPGVYEIHSHAYVGGNEVISYETDGFTETAFHYVAVPGAGTYTYVISYNQTLPEGTVIDFNEIHLHSSGFDDSFELVYGTYACSSAYAGPGVPAGYVLKYITCDVAVHNAPGGTPVGSNAVKAGQTFYVNPTPQTAPDGSSWTQVFVSSTPDPWIPTRCIN